MDKGTENIVEAYPDFRGILASLFDDCFVVEHFKYKGLILDYCVIATDRLIEVCHVVSKEQYARELATVGRAGKITFDKHKAIVAGKFISNAFYFMCPSRILMTDEVPGRYGLITYDKQFELKFRKEADWIDPLAYLPKSFYKTLAEKLARQLYQK